MNTRAFTLALVIALAAMFMVYTYVEDQKSELIKNYGQEKSVVIAKVDIQELELIDDSKVTVTSVPENFAAPGRFEKIEEVNNTIATVPILKGEQITKPRLTFPGAQSGLARQVSAGKRAIALQANPQQAVSRLIKPGDRVDIIASIDYTGGARKDKQKVKTILQDVLVLSTGLSMTNSIPLIGVETPSVIRKMKLNTYSTYTTVTLEVDPFQAQKLTFLITTGANPYLVLRNNNDKKIIDINGTDFYEILGEDASDAKIFFADKYDKKR